VADSGAMSAPSAGDLATRLAELEREVRELRLRVIQLERLVGSSGPHAMDRSTVQEKVSFDWQAPDRD
jgi:hypothetical protein